MINLKMIFYLYVGEKKYNSLKCNTYSGLQFGMIGMEITCSKSMAWKDWREKSKSVFKNLFK